MELKVVCGCGQKYKFDVEPVNGRMPMTITCPSCGVDGTGSANEILAQHSPDRSIPAAVPVALAMAPATGGLRINHAAPSTTAPPPLMAPATIAPVRPVATGAPKVRTKEFNLGLGILGALIGALLGGALVYGFYEWAGFRFPLSGIAIGALAGYGARWMARGTDTTLGIIAGGLALASVVGTFYLIYGEFFMFGIISIVICVGVAYRAASE
jgi:hypothetical protein